MTKRRRYCRGCGERIHRASYRCHYCRRTVLPWRFYLIVAGVVAGVYVALKYFR